jgi:hypothetical protein
MASDRSWPVMLSRRSKVWRNAHSHQPKSSQARKTIFNVAPLICLSSPGIPRCVASRVA